MIMSFLLPLIYSICIGLCWGAVFKKKFLESLAPAYIFHVLLVIIMGLITNSLLVGLYAGLILTAVGLGTQIFLNRQAITKSGIINYTKKAMSEGVLVFIIFFVFCFVLNHGKRYVEWDEFSHWGMFLKESMRLDKFYCTSDLLFAHKDYVPAITIFEYIYCKIGGDLSEADSYRAIQIFGFSMMMLFFESIYSIFSTYKKSVKYVAVSIMLFLCPLIMPFIFCQKDGFRFYHSIYCDFILGLFFAYLLIEAYKTYSDFSYQCFVLTIGFTGFILSKMMAIAMFPMAVVLLIATRAITKSLSKKNIYKYILMLGFPLIIWQWFNSYIKNYVSTDESIQSYGNISFSMLKDVFGNATDSSITFIVTLRENYINALIDRNILMNGSYVAVLLILVIVLLELWYFTKDKEKKNKTLVASICILLFGIGYAILMYFLYAVCFGEYEATILASYERYMNSFMLGAIFLALFVYYDSKLWDVNKRLFNKLFIGLVIYVFIFNADNVTQILPGTLTNDAALYEEFEENANVIMESTPVGAKIFIMKRGDNGFAKYIETYYCNGRLIEGYPVGTPMYEGDIYTQDISWEEFVNVISDYDYIYFYSVDDDFIIKYSEAFVNPEKIMETVAYKVTVVDGKILLE